MFTVHLAHVIPNMPGVLENQLLACMPNTSQHASHRHTMPSKARKTHHANRGSNKVKPLPMRAMVHHAEMLQSTLQPFAVLSLLKHVKALVSAACSQQPAHNLQLMMLAGVFAGTEPNKRLHIRP
jgi:hypothetical protein